ncbi:MAG: hypothetical protein KC776_37385 [Myxococcales bacterium]|nr:hypothetical protein [Myxococcales bacterium]
MLLDGMPARVFAAGEHVYPADLARLRELAAALEADGREIHDVPIQSLAQEVPRRLELAALRGFLARHRPDFDAQLDSDARLPSLRYAEEHLASLVAMGVEEPIVSAARDWRDRVADPDWRPIVDVDQLQWDVIEHARLVDIEGRRRHGWELQVDIDVAVLVLLAIQCCVDQLADALTPLAGLDSWTELELAQQGPPLGEGVVRVRPSMYFESIERLAFADVTATPTVAPRGALLHVTIPQDDG